MAEKPFHSEIRSAGKDFLKRNVWLLVILSAILLRLALLALPPFSTDTQRFFADGLNVAQGKNPYTAPSPVKIEYSHLRSFYPPLQQIFFGAAVSVFPSPFVFRLCAGFAELVFLFWFLRRQFSRAHRLTATNQWLAVFLLFNPVSLHEIWREGHLDHIAAFLLYMAIVNARAAFGYRRSALRRYLYALGAIAFKFYGILAVAFYQQRRSALRWKRLLDRGFSVFGILCGLFFLLQLAPALYITPFAEQGVLVYAQYWHHGNGLVLLFEKFGFAAPHGVYLVQRGILVAGAIALFLYLLKRVRYYDALYFSLGSLVVFFPVQHPWYYFILFPVILLSPRWRWGMVTVCLLSPLSYLGYFPEYKAIGFVVTTTAWGIFCFTRRFAYR